MGTAVDIALFIAAPFLFAGVIGRVKAAAAGRKGPPLLQPFFEFAKLVRKGEAVSRTTGFVFRIAPSVGLAATAAAALFVPLAHGRPLLSFAGDFVVFAYLLGLGKFLSAAAALDTGSSFEGMGAAREVSWSVLAEPAFFLLAGTLALVSGRASFASLFGFGGSGSGLAFVTIPLAALAFFLMILIEGCRVPVDDPATHLELTMVHEVMVLDNSGPDLAFIQLGASLKNVLYASLAANLFLPFVPGPAWRVLAWAGVVLALALLVGIVESVIARIRLTHVPQFVFVMTAIALVALFAAAFAGSVPAAAADPSVPAGGAP